METIKCPHCGKEVEVNPGKLMGEKSGEKRRGNSELMRELVKKRWAKKKTPTKPLNSTN